MKDLFGNEYYPNSVHVNIYADEIQGKLCPFTNCTWNYIGIIVEDLDHPLLDDIIYERFKGNFNQHSRYYKMNNKIVHWSEIRIADTKNICKRWFQYILMPANSRRKFYSYILGLNDSFLIKERFDIEHEFVSKYNRFFRTAVLYSLKTFFSGKEVIIENIFHEEGQQQDHKIFPWHIIQKLSNYENISFKCKEIEFLPKDHKKDRRSNIIQLCDVVLGVSTSIIHGIERSRASKYREELADLYSGLLKRIIENPKKKSSFEYSKRIIIAFFPIEKIGLGDSQKMKNQFYSNRPLYYLEQKSGQQRFCF